MYHGELLVLEPNSLEENVDFQKVAFGPLPHVPAAAWRAREAFFPEACVLTLKATTQGSDLQDCYESPEQ